MMYDMLFHHSLDYLCCQIEAFDRAAVVLRGSPGHCHNSTVGLKDFNLSEVLLTGCCVVSNGVSHIVVNGSSGQ